MHTFIFWIAKEEISEWLSQNKSSKNNNFIYIYMNVHIELGYTNKSQVKSNDYRL